MISLCLIVRDEAEMLPGCLAAARGLWDELVVVDTGSVDATVEIARAAGARVIAHPWADDFAAARNAGLVTARGDWIVCLDADERASPELVQQVRRLADDDRAGAATVVMRNALPNGHRRDTSLLRVFRNDSSVRFRHPIHEEVATSVEAYLARTGRRLVHLSGVVDHLGYTKERATAKNKRERDVRLLRRCIEADRRDLYSWFKLLEAAAFWEDGALLSETARAVESLLTEVGPALLAGARFGGDLLVLLARGLHAGDASRSLRFLQRWVATVPASAGLLYHLGELHERCGHRDDAAAAFGRCLAMVDQTPDRQMATVRPLMGLARLALSVGDLAAAWGHTEAALAENARDREALLSGVALQQALGGPARVASFVSAYVARHGETPELGSTLRELGLGQLARAA